MDKKRIDVTFATGIEVFENALLQNPTMSKDKVAYAVAGFKSGALAMYVYMSRKIREGDITEFMAEISKLKEELGQ